MDRGKQICIQQNESCGHTICSLTSNEYLTLIRMQHAIECNRYPFPDDHGLIRFRHLTAAQPGCCRRSSKRLMTSTKTTGGMLEIWMKDEGKKRFNFQSLSLLRVIFSGFGK